MLSSPYRDMAPGPKPRRWTLRRAVDGGFVVASSSLAVVICFALVQRTTWWNQTGPRASTSPAALAQTTLDPAPATEPAAPAPEVGTPHLDHVLGMIRGRDSARAKQKCVDPATTRGIPDVEKVFVSISPSGKPIDANALPASPLGDCLAHEVLTWTFPAKGEPSRTVVPFVLKSR